MKKCSERIDKDTGMALPLYDQGDYYIQPWSGEDNPPALISPQGIPGYPPIHFKGGNIVQAIVNVWAMEKFGGTIGLGLMAVQWRGEGQQISPKANLNLFTAAPAKSMDNPLAQFGLN